jgi:hypothetical protein
MRGKTDQEQKTIRAITDIALNNMRSERYSSCPGENPSSEAVALVLMLTVQEVSWSIESDLLFWHFPDTTWEAIEI